MDCASHPGAPHAEADAVQAGTSSGERHSRVTRRGSRAAARSTRCAAQRAEGRDARADPELRRHRQPVRLLPAGYGGRRRPEPLHAVEQPPLRDLQQDRGASGRPAAGEHALPGRSSPYCGARNRGDPIVLYDQYAQRWMASQFAFDGPALPRRSTSASRSRPPATRPVAGARTTSSFHQVKFNDYPKFGIWPAQNTYTMTAPQFGGNNGQGVWGFERDKMLACQTAGMGVSGPGHLRREPAAHPAGGRRRGDRAAGERAAADRHRQRRRRRATRTTAST